MNLFGEEVSPKAIKGDVTVTKNKKEELTKGQKAFNRLSKKVEDLRKKIERATAILDESLVFYGQKIAPLDRLVIEQRAEILDLLFPYLEQGIKLTEKDREAMIDMLSNLLDMVWCYTPEAEERHRMMFEELEGMTPEEADELEADAMKEELEWMFSAHGVDIDLSDVDVTDEEQMARKMRELQEELGPDPFRPKQRERKKTKKQMEAEARAEAMEKARKQSLSSIYRQLAKALHPDLEQDETLRAEKEELMKQLTTAYDANDLHTLLAIETRWVKKNDANLRDLTDEKIEIFNEVLKEQVSELEGELWRVYAHPRYAPLQRFGMGSPWGIKYGIEDAEPKLREKIANIKASIAALKGPAALKEVKALIKENKRIMREMEREIHFI